MDVVFYRTHGGSEPARDFLRALPKDDRAVVGEDLKTVQYGFPIGMPLCRPLGGGLFEVRSSLPSRREVRCLFAPVDGEIWVLHAFFKTTKSTPPRDIALARSRIP